MKDIKDITYNHKKYKTALAIGMTDDRWDEIWDTARDVILESGSHKSSEYIELVIDSVEPESLAEYVAIGMAIQAIKDGMRNEVKELADHVLRKHVPDLKDAVSRAKQVLEMLSQEDESDEDEEEEKPRKKKIIN